ncbi:hypothetical protein STRDD11_00122 [Streptococcus sp. DD11]|nr:hypothetical protein STRDD11_00122 [Streptococcus sp. DD11]
MAGASSERLRHPLISNSPNRSAGNDAGAVIVNGRIISTGLGHIKAAAFNGHIAVTVNPVTAGNDYDIGSVNINRNIIVRSRIGQLTGISAGLGRPISRIETVISSIDRDVAASQIDIAAFNPLVAGCNMNR